MNIEYMPSDDAYKIVCGTLNFNYIIRGECEWMPKSVFNDGVNTYIKMQRGIKANTLPLLVVVDREGNQKETEYKVIGENLIVDFVLNDAYLTKGANGKPEIVEITNVSSSACLESNCAVGVEIK